MTVSPQLASLLEGSAPAPWESGRRFQAAVIASSAGGVRALLTVVSALPAVLPLAVLIAQHLSRDDPGLLLRVLAYRARVPVEWAVDGASIGAGTVYLTPPGFDLRVTAEHRACLTRAGPKQRVAPRADLLFASAAAAYRERLIAVVLTGHGSDGARGVVTVKRRGGVVIAQDPGTAASPDMPRAAINTGAVELTLGLAHIAPALIAAASGERLPPPGYDAARASQM